MYREFHECLNKFLSFITYVPKKLNDSFVKWTVGEHYSSVKTSSSQKKNQRFHASFVSTIFFRKYYF